MIDFLFIAGNVIILGMAFVVMAAALLLCAFMAWIVRDMLR